MPDKCNFADKQACAKTDSTAQSSTVKILAVSDQVVERVYTLIPNGRFQGTEIILGCGDLPYSYLEYLVTLLNVQMYYVPGNHDPQYDLADARSRAEGGSNLDLKTARHKNVLIGGFGGCIRYRPDGVNQYTQSEAYLRAFRMCPALLLNRIKHGRAMDILISHSPPFGIHDDLDTAHNGLKALNWLIRIAKPRFHFHGHTHFYKNNLEAQESMVGRTKVINVYPYKILEV
ncbi:MAG: metallophosphoesterase [Anaerolineales bacterium]|nr:metallophosphoesterase [Anaerolineales bacterium]